MVEMKTALSGQETPFDIGTTRVLNSVTTAYANLRFEYYKTSVLTRKDYSLTATTR